MIFLLVLKLHCFAIEVSLRFPCLRLVDSNELHVHRKSSDGENHHCVHIVKNPSSDGEIRVSARGGGVPW